MDKDYLTKRIVIIKYLLLIMKGRPSPVELAAWLRLSIYCNGEHIEDAAWVCILASKEDHLKLFLKVY